MQAIFPPELRAKVNLFGYAVRETARFIRENKRFVHYTSAVAAKNIIQTETVWMRNARLMNDFSEIEYGKQRLDAALKSPSGQKLKQILSQHSPELVSLLEDFDKAIPSICAETFILSLSEHDGKEDQTGRLSMWRAYGDRDGVAIILNSAPFVGGAADISPVGYLSEQAFIGEFSRVVDQLPSILSLTSSHIVGPQLLTALMFALTCTKHPGFEEEKEWRLVHRHDPSISTIMIKGNESPRGFAEDVYKIPLANRPDLSVSGIEIRELIDRIIIGPSDRAADLRMQFIDLLSKRGLANPERRVIASNIPYRHVVTVPTTKS